MPGNLTPAQMFDHELNPVKGWPSPYAVDKTKEIATGQTGIFAGTVISIDPTEDKFVKGLAVPYAMAIFAFQNQNDFDVNGDVGNISGIHLTGLVAAGAYELETTQFDGVGFTPNTPLEVNGDGEVIAGTVSGSDVIDTTNGVVGVVSDAGPITNDFKKQVVRFWPVYLPPNEVA